MNEFQKRQQEYARMRQKSDSEISAAELGRTATQNNYSAALNTMVHDNNRAIETINNAPVIINDIHTQFEKATELNEKDIAFLFGAAAIQTARWALLPELDWNFNKVSTSERLDAASGGKIETTSIIEKLKSEGLNDEQIKNAMNHKHINNYTWQKLLIAPVPYDAMKGSARIIIKGISEEGTNLYGKNHHVATWGHDPVWGWLFGPLNIATRTITFRDFQTFHVAQIGDSFDQKITYRSSISTMIPRAIQIFSDDSKKLFASIAKQGIHLQSDKYTKLGLPIPFLNAEKAQELLLKGWNSNEVERLFQKASKNLAVIGAQFGLALLIDNLVKGLHLLCYDESVDGSPALYAVKTNKMICYSNAIAEIANGIYVAASRNVGKLDIGGYINLAKNLISNSKLRNQVEAEFLEKELSKKIYNDNYYWEEF